MKEDTYRDAKLWIEGFANVIHQRDILAAALRRINDNPCTECMHDQWALDALQEAGMDDNGPSKTVAGGEPVTRGMPKWDVCDPAMDAARRNRLVLRRARLARRALNELADALVAHRHKWSPDLRRLYERGAGALRAIEKEVTP